MDRDDDRSQELANKVDTLVGKLGVATDARNIPVLTDLVEAPQWTPELPSGTDRIPPPAADFLQSLSEADIDQLSHEIFQRVAQRMDGELATSLEARLGEQFQSQLHATISHVLADMKQSIANEIGDAVNAALADRLRKK